MKKVKKLQRQLAILLLQREILAAVQDIEDMQSGKYHRAIGFNGAECIGYCEPDAPDDDEDEDDEN